MARRLTIWLDAREGDSRWRPGVTALSARMDALGVPHEFHVLAGSHQEDQYWARHGAEYLRFYARALTAPVRATARAGA